MSDTKLFRQAFKDAGFRQRYTYAPTVFNDKYKDGAAADRLKLWFGDPVFEAPQHEQIELERQLKLKFGARYLFGQFIPQHSWTQNCGKAFVVYLLTA